VYVDAKLVSGLRAIVTGTHHIGRRSVRNLPFFPVWHMVCHSAWLGLGHMRFHWWTSSSIAFAHRRGWWTARGVAGGCGRGWGRSGATWAGTKQLDIAPRARTKVILRSDRSRSKFNKLLARAQQTPSLSITPNTRHSSRAAPVTHVAARHASDRLVLLFLAANHRVSLGSGGQPPQGPLDQDPTWHQGMTGDSKSQ
jgi:hypothetical protein